MIRRDPHWGAAEWIIVLVWKAATLALLIVVAYLAVTGPQLALHIIGGLYVPFALAAFLLTQPDV